MSTATPAVPGAACAASTYAMAIGLPSVGDGAPGGDLADHRAVGRPTTGTRRAAPGGPRRPGRPACAAAAVSARSAAAASASRPTKSPPLGLLELHDPAQPRVERRRSRWSARARTAACPPPGAACRGRTARTAPGRRPRPPRSAPPRAATASAGRDEQLEAVLAGVAGTGDQRRHAGDGAGQPRVVLEPVQVGVGQRLAGCRGTPGPGRRAARRRRGRRGPRRRSRPRARSARPAPPGRWRRWRRPCTPGRPRR